MSTFGKLGNGMPSNQSPRRRGVDPPKNESGTATAVPHDLSHKVVSSGNGACITARTFSNSGPGMSGMPRPIWCTRSLCSSKATILSTQSSSVRRVPSRMRRSNAGQTSSVSFAGVLEEQTSRKLRRRGDPKTMLRHRRHTCTSDCHASMSFFENVASSAKKSNTSSRTSSGSMSIVII